MISFKKFAFWFYKKTFQLKNHDEIQIPRIGIVLIYGKSGEGKSTLFNALLNKKIRSKIINLDSDIAVFKTEDSVPNNYLTRDLLQTVNRDTLNHDIINFLNLNDLLSKKIVALSGGEKSRVRLAMILESNAKILLLDEPHVMVDEDKIEGEMKAIKKTAEKKLIFIITHYPQLYATPYRIKIEDGTLINESEKNIPQEAEFIDQKTDDSKGLIGKRARKESLFHAIYSFLSVFIGLLLFVFSSTIATFSSLTSVKPNFDIFGEGYNARKVSVSSLEANLSNIEKDVFFAYADADSFEKYYEYELLDKGYPPQPEFLLESRLEAQVADSNFISPINHFYKVKGNIEVIESFGKTTDLYENEIVLTIQKEGLEFNDFRGFFSTLSQYAGTEYDALRSIEWDTQTIATTYKYRNFGEIQATIDFSVCGVILTESYNGYYSDNDKWNDETIINDFFGSPTIVDQRPNGAIDKTYVLRTLFARYTGNFNNVDNSVVSAINDSGYDLTYYVNVNDDIIVAINSKNKVFTKQKIADVFASLPANLTINNYVPQSLNSFPLVEWKEANILGLAGISPLSFTNANNYSTLGYKQVMQASDFSWEDDYFVMSKELASRYYSQRENKLSFDDNELDILIGETFDFGAFSLKLGAIVIDKLYPELSFAMTSINHLLAINQYYFSQTYDVMVNDYMSINEVMNYYTTGSMNRGTALYDFNIERVQLAIDKYENYKALIAKSTASSLVIAGITLIVILVIYALTLRIIRKNDNFFANVVPKKSLFQISMLRLIFPLFLMLISFILSSIIYSAVQDSFISTFTNFTFNNSLGGINLNKTLLIDYFPLVGGIMIGVILISTLLVTISALIRINPRERSNY